jgi:hypothetical protein
LILFNSPELFRIRDNQFGFKQNNSCNHAIFVVKETVLNYTEHRSSCKIASLDAEKAFDRVWRDGLFHKLLTKIHPSYWFVLRKYYDSSLGIIKEDDNSNHDFEITCGVKLGGILSPYLFNLFIHDLPIECLEKNIGAIFKNLNVSIIAYAADIILISQSDKHLQLLLDICTSYSDRWKIKFNSKKSHIIKFGKSPFSDDEFFLCYNKLNFTKSITYLGVEIPNDLNCNSNYIYKFSKVKSTLFSMAYLGIICHEINPSLKSFIYKTYCSSQFTFGPETTTLNKTSIDFLNISQNNLIRYMLRLKSRSVMSTLIRVLKIFKI